MANRSDRSALTISEAAEFLGVSACTLRNWDRAGKLKTFRHAISGYRLYPRDQLLELQKTLLRPPLETEHCGDQMMPSDAPTGGSELPLPGSPRRPSREPGNLGQHMTPPSVARQMVSLLQRPLLSCRIIDPACGDGNLLLAVADRMLDAGLHDVVNRIAGIDIDEEMVKLARRRLADRIKVNISDIQIFAGDFLEQSSGLLFSQSPLDFREFNVVLSNPPYGRSREYAFFTRCSECLPEGSELVFLVPLSFIDRAEGLFTIPLEGRPLGVTTGHAIVRHVCGQPYRFRPIKEHQHNRSPFSVLSGVKLYEVGAGVPPQTQEIVEKKPFSSAFPKKKWLPCLRTGDIHPSKYTIGRLFVHYGEHLAPDQAYSDAFFLRCS